MKIQINNFVCSGDHFELLAFTPFHLSMVIMTTLLNSFLNALGICKRLQHFIHYCNPLLKISELFVFNVVISEL